MFAFLPLLLLAVVLALVSAIWHRPDPNHLFILKLLRDHVRDESELSRDSPNGS
jgi:hypothetical protein